LAPPETGLAQVVLEGTDAQADEQREHYHVERQQHIEVGGERTHPVASVEGRDDQRQRRDGRRLGGDAKSLAATEQEAY
jgi:hypothetical protein